MKYAQFKDMKFGWINVVGRHESDLERPYCDTVRVSEWIEIDFPPLPDNEVVPQQLAALDRKQQELVREHLAALQKIADQRAKLLCLTHEVAE
jgi:hypothetical protein